MDESIIIPTKAPAKPRRHHLEGEEEKVYDEEGDDVDGFHVTPTSPHHGDGDDVDDDIDPLDAPVEGMVPDADQISVFEEQLVKEEIIKNGEDDDDDDDDDDGGDGGDGAGGDDDGGAGDDGAGDDDDDKLIISYY